MSTQVTEAHRELARTIRLHLTLGQAYQVIADSEAKAVEAERARLYGIGRKKGEQPVSSDMDIGHRCLSGDKWPQPVDPIAECARLGRELADSIAERDQLRAEVEQWELAFQEQYARAERAEAEVERLKKQIKDDNRSYGCELRDPYGTIWEQATKDHDRAGKAERALAELREWQAGVIANERLHHAERKDAIARAEKAESELAGIRALADRRNKRDHSQDTTHQLVAALDQALDIAQAELAATKSTLDEEVNCAEKAEHEVVRQYARAERAEAELATERARLDWLELRGPWDSWNGFGETGITLRENIRAAIDGVMKEGA